MDKDKIKSFFVNHVEKIILGIVACFSLFLIYSGLSLENYDKITPKDLGEDATEVLSAIKEEDHNDAVVGPRGPTFNIVERTEQAQNEVDYSPYGLVKTWVRTSQDSTIKRVDPKIIAPESLLVSAQAHVIAARGASPDYALADMEGAEELEKIEKKPRQRRRSRRNMGMMDGMEMEGMEMMEGEGEMYGGMGDSMATTTAKRELPKDADFGTVPTNVKVLGEDSIEDYPVPKAIRYIAATAAVPHEKIYDAYKASFKDAAAYNAKRDKPTYKDFQVQRADVTTKSVENLTDEDWENVTSAEDQTLQYAQQFAGFAPEIVPEDFRDINITMWIPPILKDDYRSFVTHPLVPMSVDEDEEQLSDEEKRKAAKEREFKRNVSGANISSSAGMYGGDYGSEMDGMMMGEGEDMGGMYGGVTDFSRFEEADPVDYKLVRFFDFEDGRNNPGLKPRHKYVYRVRVGLEDPNFPISPSAQPELKALDPEVFKRVNTLIGKAVEADERAPFSVIWSEWSAPSAPIELPDLSTAYAGPVESIKESTFDFGGRKVTIETDEPKAKMVTRMIDPTLGGVIPAWIDVTEGSVLATEVEKGEIVDPVTGKVKAYPDARILSNSTVIDIDGGRELSIVAEREDEMKEPALFLLFDGDGHLRVTGEVEDQEEYRAWSFAEDRGL